MIHSNPPPHPPTPTYDVLIINITTRTLGFQ
jgi:hypothetical protein